MPRFDPRDRAVTCRSPQVRQLGFLPQMSGPLPVRLAWPRDGGPGRHALHGAQGGWDACGLNRGFRGRTGTLARRSARSRSLPVTSAAATRRPWLPGAKLIFRNADTNPGTCDRCHKLVLVLAKDAAIPQVSSHAPCQLHGRRVGTKNIIRTIDYVNAGDRYGARPLPVGGLIRDRFRKN